MIGKLIRLLPKDINNYIELKKIDRNKRKKYSEIEHEIGKTYKKVFGRELMWEKPQTYTEKIQVSKLYNSNELKTKLTDKVLAKEWVKEKIGEEFLIPTLGVYNSFDTINFEELPQNFVIKANHDSGSTEIVNDKSLINIKKMKKKYDFFLKRNFAYTGYEMQYKHIEPKIIIEENMGAAINDYKFLCFNGKPYYCWVDIDRFSNHKRNIYDMNWNLQKFNQMTYGNYEGKIECPKEFNKMKSIAEKLSSGFDHVRVDLYVINEKVYFGEMTFSNGNGYEIITPDEYDFKLGTLWGKLDMNNRKEKLNKIVE